MEKKMMKKQRNPVVIGLGIGCGTCIFDVIRHGIANVDWWRGAYVAVISVFLLAIVAKLASGKMKRESH